jgi:ABC-type multidrug transport system fused ATPase/permease subunit
MGVIMNAVGAVICSLTIAFLAGWKLSFIILLFVPLIVFSGMLQGKRMAKANATKEKKSTAVTWGEKGGMVNIYCYLFRHRKYFHLIQFSTEAIDNVRTVVGIHQEQYFIEHYEDAFNKEFR